MKWLPFVEINLVYYRYDKWDVDVVLDNGHNDCYTPVDMIILMFTKDNTTEIDNLIKILQLYKLIVKNKSK